MKLNSKDDAYEFLDVSGYAAPEPLQMALEATLRISPGRFLYLEHRKYPRLLYERLQQRGFDSDTRRGDDGECKVFIWKHRDSLALDRVMIMASRFEIWHE